jgi:4-hydroxy-tetrahydrodipicolinate synthase
MIELFDAGDAAAARDVHLRILPVLHGFFRTQGVILTKAALNAAGLPAGPVRLPLVEATETEVAQLRHDCEAAGIDLDNLVGGRTA